MANRYVVALYLEHKRNIGVAFSVNELLKLYDLDDDEYMKNKVARLLSQKNWVEPRDKTLSADDPMTITFAGETSAEVLESQNGQPVRRAHVEVSGATLTINAGSPDITFAPASYRIVNIDDNMRQSIDPELAELIIKIEASDAPLQVSGLKQEIVTLLSAGREFIRLGGVKWEILQLTLFEGVQRVIDRYSDQVITKLAVDLMAKMVVVFVTYLIK